MTNQLEALIAEMKAAAEKAIEMHGNDWFYDDRQICTVYKSKIKLISAAKPENILTLIAALEQSKNDFKRLDERNATLNSTLDRWAVERAENANVIAELESEKVTASNALLDAGKRIAELESDNSALRHVRAELSREANDLEAKLEASQLAVKLPKVATVMWHLSDQAKHRTTQENVRDVLEAIRAGGTVQGDE